MLLQIIRSALPVSMYTQAWLGSTYFETKLMTVRRILVFVYSIEARKNPNSHFCFVYSFHCSIDTGTRKNKARLPAYPYEAAFAIQDRRFKNNGELFYPAFPGDPAYDDFIDADVDLDEDQFPDGGVRITCTLSNMLPMTPCH